MSLIDTLIGISLVLVGALVFASAFPVASEARNASEKNSFAITMAEREIEMMRNIPFASVVSHGFETPLVAGSYGYAEVSAVPDNPRLKQVDIMVRWYVDEQPKNVALTTYISER